ncbi:hypothetical protein B0J11DRAFT_9130 [Dendryphion nanum]|uniref:Mid2 domain-containing protein n=1 Tax=Dendryphion nanum TaxID=256645 RepID=A0A9P9J1Q7_9PLEO|nr:hypothetical protein B0J11DRAFT_9130 [Dendryphion nanum]
MALFWLLLACIWVVAQAENTFLAPCSTSNAGDYSQAREWTEGSIMRVEWSSDLKSYFIGIKQEIDGQARAEAGPALHRSEPNQVRGSLTWSVSAAGMDLRKGNVFFLTMRDSDTNLWDYATSCYFKIAKFTSSSATSASSTILIPSTTFSTSATTVSTPTPTPSQERSTAANNNGNNDNASKIGLGVGLGIGIPIIILLAVCVGFLMKWWKGQETRQQLTPLVEKPEDVYLVRPEFAQAVTELPSELERRELPAYRI